MKVVHIVRRWGPVGGMEKYVFELASAQVTLGLDVIIVCDQIHADSHGITIKSVPRCKDRPRWLGMLQFRKAVSKLVREEGYSAQPNVIIHSHERSADHHVTTFHGPPMAGIKQRKRFWWTSPRLWTWLKLEALELSAPQVRAVVPNSLAIAQQLRDFYPNSDGLISSTIGWPGVDDVAPCSNTSEIRVVFVGKEWKRKGLEKAIRVVAQTRDLSGREISLVVVGPRYDDVKHLLEGYSWISYEGWRSDWTSLGNFLIHPATVEPYGMVVSEAMASGMQVLVSSESGVSDHYGLNSLSAECEDREWASALLHRALNPVSMSKQHLYRWTDLAGDMLAVYKRILK